MDCNIGIKGEGFEYIFGRGKGLVSIRYNGVQLLDDTVRPNFWRAPTNNGKNQPTPPGAPGGSLLVCTHSVACCGYSARQTFRNQNEGMGEKGGRGFFW